MRALNVQRLCLGIVLALASVPAFALSLGQVQMRSSLGQPLLAEIPVYDADDQDAQSLSVELASQDAFRRLGLDRKIYQDIQVDVLNDDSGQLIVQLRSSQPFNEPVLNLLLNANWQNGGHVVKEFTALVDPPYIAKAAVQTIDSPTVGLRPVVAAPVVTPIERTPSIPVGSASSTLAAKPMPAKPKPTAKTSSKPVSEQANNKVPATVKTTSEPPAKPIEIPATADNQLLVEKGDNLFTLAERHQQQLAAPSVSLNQMMSAIQRANPKAFINGNRNLLKRGSVLRLPNEQQVRALLPEDSANLLQNQWAKKVQAQPAPVLNAANKLNTQTSPSQLRGSQTSTAANSTINQGRLKIVPTAGTMNNAGSQSGASKSGQGQELRAENATSQEELVSGQVEISSLKNQLNDASKLQAESKRLIELQSTQIKQLTHRMQEMEKTSKASQANAATTSAVPGKAAMQKTAAGDTWYYSPYVVIIGLLLIAGLLGVFLKRKR